LHAYAAAKGSSGVYQRIERKLRDPTSEQITHTRLTDAAMLGSLRLRPSLRSTSAAICSISSARIRKLAASEAESASASQTFVTRFVRFIDVSCRIRAYVNNALGSKPVNGVVFFELEARCAEINRHAIEAAGAVAPGMEGVSSLGIAGSGATSPRCRAPP
jgi:hypothetical protein